MIREFHKFDIPYYVDDGTSDYRSSYDLEEELKSNNNEF